MLRVPAGSRETLGEPDGYQPPEGLPADPSTLTAEITVGVTLDESSPWDLAAWTADDTIVSTMSYGVVGSGAAVVMQPGIYDVWVRVADAPGRPVRRVDKLVVEGFDTTTVTVEDGGGAVPDPDAVIEEGGGA